MDTKVGRLAGKVAIITGAASSFGLATVHKFLTEGAQVVAVNLNSDALNQHFAASAVTTVVANVASLADWESVVKTTLEKYSMLDILVNNAGTTYRNKPSLEATDQEFDTVFEVNTKSIYLSSRIVIPVFQKQGHGSIVNIASIGASRPRPGFVWYNGSKAAVVNVSPRLDGLEFCLAVRQPVVLHELTNYQISKGLAAEFGRDHVRINCVCPLLSGTGLFESFVGVPHTVENVKKFLFKVPLGRLAEGEDIANACCYLGSDEAQFVTGVCLKVDGGRAVGA
ncbi:hypothetical protein LTR41_011514 [Exophiala xenobiotica]|nr:hypothetical protein LTR41_011514 [Exophiala xenobiotica]